MLTVENAEVGGSFANWKKRQMHQYNSHDHKLVKNPDEKDRYFDET